MYDVINKEDSRYTLVNTSEFSKFFLSDIACNTKRVNIRYRRKPKAACRLNKVVPDCGLIPVIHTIPLMKLSKLVLVVDSETKPRAAAASCISTLWLRLDRTKIAGTDKIIKQTLNFSFWRFFNKDEYDFLFVWCFLLSIITRPIEATKIGMMRDNNALPGDIKIANQRKLKAVANRAIL